ncbi:energy transducer TonB [Kordiimonas sp.]|uniref:energy transducer TonB n=1 Tax=Kordiimonas sp. TaxID=1970157 RepID=UPI003A9003A8
MILHRTKAFLLGAAISLVGFSGPSLADDDGLRVWGAKVYDAFASKQRYPRRAVDDKLEGTVKIQVTVAKTGAIIGFGINRSSGHEVLDAEVLDLLGRVNPLPPLPEGKESYVFKIPLRFQMDETETRMDASVTVDAASSNWKDWQRAVQRTLARNQGYPTQLIEEGIEGQVKVQVNVAADGTITAQSIAQSSGSDILDDEALDLMRRISFPALPEAQQSIAITIPLNYRLDGRRG